jgi:hypothetical protein
VSVVDKVAITLSYLLRQFNDRNAIWQEIMAQKQLQKFLF